MSRYDLEEALREFINHELQEYESNHDHADDYAEREHEHDNDFESKVDYYLDGFEVGTGCRTKQAFERAVMTCVAHWFDNTLTGAEPIRALLRAVLVEARRANKPMTPTIEALTRCLESLRAIPTIDPMAAEQSSDNGLTYTRT